MSESCFHAASSSMEKTTKPNNVNTIRQKQAKINNMQAFSLCHNWLNKNEAKMKPWLLRALVLIFCLRSFSCRFAAFLWIIVLLNDPFSTQLYLDLDVYRFTGIQKSSWFVQFAEKWPKIIKPPLLHLHLHSECRSTRLQTGPIQIVPSQSSSNGVVMDLNV